jgi:protocatechuate 3,4-dioxygenase beta subunit
MRRGRRPENRDARSKGAFRFRLMRLAYICEVPDERSDHHVRGRRDFLRGSGIAVGALLAPRTLLAQSCVTTSPDAFGLGPFYLPNSPVRTSALAAVGEPGEVLGITGVVSDCSGPLPGARVEVWHANAAGCYPGFPESQVCTALPGEPDSTRLRGTFVADAQGRYGYTTVMPAGYVDGSTTRTAHIHYRITLPSASGPEVELITQLYFQGAHYVEEDDGAEDALAVSGLQRIIARTPRSGGGTEGVFNIVLPAATSALRRGPESLAALAGFDLMILRDGRDVRFLLPPFRLPGTVLLRVASLDGRELHASRHAGREVRWDASRFPSGTYAVELRSSHSPSRESFRLSL